MGSIGCDIGKKGCLIFAPHLHPGERLAEEQIRAVTFCFFELAIVPDGGIEIGVARRIATTAGVALSDAAGAVDEYFVEAAFAGLIWCLVAEMPFAKDAGRVASGLQHLGDGHRFETHPFAFKDRMRNAGTEFMPASHQGAARG